MITPILKDPRSHGGTLYTFPSASRDLTRAFTNSEYEFAFSHFACLNLPDFRYGTFKSETTDKDGNIIPGDPKGIYLDNLVKYFYPNSDSILVEDSDSDTIMNFTNNDLNKCLKWHLQSYVMNCEIAILNGGYGTYDDETLKTPSERIFFNWLQRVGAIKFDGNGETLEGYGIDVDGNIEYETLNNELELPTGIQYRNKTYRIGNRLYNWKGGEWRSRLLISNTVQYIGTIDMINNVNIDYDSFNEVYLNIPAGVGGSTNIYFDNNVFDNNYKQGVPINVKTNVHWEEPAYIIGRNPNKLNIAMEDSITLKAIYDSKFEIYYSNSDSNSESEYDIVYSEPIYQTDNGYCINFNDDRYDDGIESMNLNSNDDFEFNCVLIYYRIRKSNGEWQTNLYGVLFLEEVTPTDYNVDNNADNERAGYIQRYPKFKKGNSWGLKLDLKIDAQPDSQMELRNKLYDDPNEGSGMQMFTEALIQLNDCVKLFYDVKKENTSIEERLSELENIISGVDAVYDLRNEIGSLRTRVETFQPTLNSLGGRMDNIESRIANLENKIGLMIKDYSTIRLQSGGVKE